MLKLKEIPIYPLLKDVIKYIMHKMNHTIDPNAYLENMYFLGEVSKWVLRKGICHIFNMQSENHQQDSTRNSTKKNNIFL